MASEKFVTRAISAFGGYPVDDFVGVHDVAGLAVDTVGEIDLEAPAAVSVFGHLINGGGTEELARIAVLLSALRMTNIGLQDVQMRRLIFIVGSAGIVDVGQLVKRELAIVAGRGKRREIAIVVFLELAHARVTGLVAVAISKTSATRDHLQAGVHHAHK